MSNPLPIENAGQDAIRDYLFRKDAGEIVDQDTFLAEHPEAADALRSFFASELLFRQLLTGEFRSSNGIAPDQRAFPTVQATAPSTPWKSLPVTLGRYRVSKLLGHGAMGTVYRAHDTELDRPVALKVPHRLPSGETMLRDRHQQEARAAAGLRHPNLCAVYDVGEINGINFIAMELIDGRPLSDFIRGGELAPAPTIVALIRRIALALQIAHDQGVIHRDLKPGNILVRKDGEPVVMDFGLARRPLAEGDERLSRDGMMIGSPAYMAPKQARADAASVGPAADIYGLGVVFYELLTGRLPFTGSVMTILAKILSEDPPSILLLRPEIDREIAGICHRMLSKCPEDRFTSMREVAEALRDCLRSSRAGAATVTPPTPAASKTPIVLHRLKPGEIKSLTRSAKRCLQQRDYAMAVQLLSQIPHSQHTQDSSRTLHHAQDLAEEVDYLSLDIDEALAARDYGSLQTTLKRFLELQPQNRRARDLSQRIVGRGVGLSLEPPRSKPHTATGMSIGSWRLAVFGIAAILVATFCGWHYSASYLSNRNVSVDVCINPASAEVQIDGQPIKLIDGQGTILLLPGHHEVIADAPGRPQQRLIYEVADGRPNQIVIELAKAAEIAPKAGTARPVNVAVETPRLPSPPTLPPQEDQLAAFEAADPEMIAGENSIGMKFVEIPAGDFLMGSPASEIGRAENELLPHRVRISRPLLASAYEVTQTEYSRVMRMNPSRPPFGGAQGDRGQFPVNQVTWFDAIRFCVQLSNMEGCEPAYRLTNPSRADGRLLAADVVPLDTNGYRLPTELEWEYLCRAGTSTPFSFGEQCHEKQANVAFVPIRGGAPKLLPPPSATAIGSYPPNAFGLFDLHGNIGEWCWTKTDESSWTVTSETARPVRGGGPSFTARFARSAARREHPAGTSSSAIGFRVVRGRGSLKSATPATDFAPP
jgi:serine/threonine protein kinase